MEALKENFSTEDDSTFSLEIVSELGELGDGAIISESALAKLLKRHSVSIKRAVLRGELPQPIRLLGQPVWTVGSIVKYLEKRLEAAANEAELQRKKIEQLRP